MPIEKSTPFTVQADHAGVDTVGYRLYVDSAMVQEKPVSALSGGVISFADADGLPKGSYGLQVSAYNADGETKSDALTLVVTGTAPLAPINLRIAAI